MTKVTACDLPKESLLAHYGGPGDYRDCFCREIAGEVTLSQYIERFYSSMAFGPERVILSLIGRGATAENIRALARGDSDRIAVWEVIERTPDQILLLSKDTNTASWLSVSSSDAAVGKTQTSSSSGCEAQPQAEPVGQQTRLLFGSWVGGIDKSGWRVMLQPHVWYSRLLLGAA